jgi:hypothetical protein
MGRRVWPRADQRHLAAQDVDELRQLIQAGHAQDSAQVGQPYIAAPSLPHDSSDFLHVHGAEIVNQERAPVQAGADLAE